MTKGVKEAWKEVLTTRSGQIVLADLLNRGCLFINSGVKEEEVLRSFFVSLLGELDLYKDTPTFQLDYVRALVNLPGGKQ